MDPFERYGLKERRVREDLVGLDWQGGLTASEIRQELPALPEDLFGDLEDGQIFHTPDEVIRAIRGEIDLDPGDFPVEGAESIGGPAGYGGSTTGRLVIRANSSGGIGSGTDTGDTGSGNTEATGWGRPGTTYGEEAVEREIEEDENGGETESGAGLP